MRNPFSSALPSRPRVLLKNDVLLPLLRTVVVVNRQLRVRLNITAREHAQLENGSRVDFYLECRHVPVLAVVHVPTLVPKKSGVDIDRVKADALTKYFGGVDIRAPLSVVDDASIDFG